MVKVVDDFNGKIFVFCLGCMWMIVVLWDGVMWWYNGLEVWEVVFVGVDWIGMYNVGGVVIL